MKESDGMIKLGIVMWNIEFPKPVRFGWERAEIENASYTSPPIGPRTAFADGYIFLAFIQIQYRIKWILT